MTAAALTPGRRTRRRSSSTTSDRTESKRGRDDRTTNDEMNKETTEKSKKKSKKTKKQIHLDDDENVTPKREQPSPVIGTEETMTDRHIVPATPSSTSKHGGSRHHHKDDSNDDGNASDKKEKKEKKKKSKKGKRNRDDDEGDDQGHDEAERTERDDRKENDDEVGDMEDDIDDVNDASSPSATSKKMGKKKGKKSRDERKREQEELLAKIPTVDEDGISYTKLQIRRMMKRVKRGLPPVPTPEEEHARLRNEAALRREEEAELAGMGVYRKTDPNGEEDDDGDDDGNADDDANDEVDGDHGGARNHNDDDDDGDDADMDGGSPDNAGDGSKTLIPSDRPVGGGPAVKKAKRNKPVPPDYVCMACQNKHGPRHWIYDCPDKVTVKGANQKKKRDRGIHDPDSRKVFVSGLPFEVKAKDVETFFDDFPGLGGKVTMCRLVKFGDTGRCNGQAYVSFDSDGAAERALQLSGTVIDASKMGGDHKLKETKGQSSSKSKRTDLKLKVSRVLNRIKTRKGNGPTMGSGQPGHRD